MKISIKDSSMVRPAQQTPKQHLWTSNMDLVAPWDYHVANVFFYRYDGSSNFFQTGHLKKSLSEILVPFYPLAGRLGSDQSGRFEIVCNSEGALFVEAETDATLDDLGDFTPSPTFRQLVPTVDYSRDRSSYPLLLLQVTKLKCGSVCIGGGFHHTLMDGNSVFYFMKSWANTTRGLSITVSPFLDRTILRASVPPTPWFHHVEYDPSPPMNPTNPHFQAAPEPPIPSIFKITVNQLKTLKAMTKLNGKEEMGYGTINILFAHIWRCVCKARGLPDDQPTKLYTPVNGRFKLNNPYLPPGYLGNAVFLAATTALSGDLQSEPLARTVERIDRMMKQVNDKYLRSALDYTESVPDIKTLTRGAHTCRFPNLNINNLTKFPIYEADFGWGRPIHYGLARIVDEGKIYITPSPVGDGSLTLTVCLGTPNMKPFEKFLYDFSFPSEKINARY